MKQMNRAFAAVAIATLLATVGTAQENPKPHPAWEEIKAMAGDWEGTYVGYDLPPRRMHFRIVSNGSAVMLTMAPETEEEMITVFHPDGAALIATHYCSSGNQPRMKAAPVSEPGVLRFTFFDATNVKTAETGHMRELVLRVHSPEHHTQEWTYKQGEKSGTGEFDMRRVK